MTCTLCHDPRCDADASHEDHDGLTDWIATARAMDRCRVTLADQLAQLADSAALLRDRALRAEAELAAMNGRPEALTPYLPDGWTWDATCCEWHGPGGLYVTEDGALGRDKPGAFWPDRRSDGLLAVMVDAVADVVAAEGEL